MTRLLIGMFVAVLLVITAGGIPARGEDHTAATQSDVPLQRTARNLRAGDELRLVLWGDSISEVGRSPRWHGGASSPQKHWGALLVQKLHAEFPQARITLIPAGIGGQNSYEGLGRLDALEALKPDLVIVAFGTNDCSHHPLQPEQSHRAQAEMIDRIKKYADVVNVSTAGNHPDDPKFSRVAQTVAASSQASSEQRVPFVDMFDAMTTLTSAGQRWGDYHLAAMNCHPNDRGHEIWAQSIARVILANVNSSAPASTTQPTAIR